MDHISFRFTYPDLHHGLLAMKKLDDMRRIGAVTCLGGGIWSLVKGIEVGGWWRLVVGIGLIVFGFVLGYYLRRESQI